MEETQEITFDFDLTSPEWRPQLTTSVSTVSTMQPPTEKPELDTTVSNSVQLCILCPSQVTHEGFQYTRNRQPTVSVPKFESATTKISAYYKCKCSRSTKGNNCSATLSVEVIVDAITLEPVDTVEGSTTNTFRGNHVCAQDKNRVVLSDGITDLREEMDEAVRQKGREYGTSRTVHSIAVEVFEEYKALEGTMGVLSDINHLENVINAQRQKENSSALAIYQMPSVNCASDDKRAFLQFDLRYTSTNTGILNHAIGWAHPDLINYVKHGRVNLFSDATFWAATKDFLQCLILMVYLKAVDMFVPIWYVLMTCKDEVQHIKKNNNNHILIHIFHIQ